VLDAAKHLESLGHTVEEVQIPDEAQSLPSDEGVSRRRSRPASPSRC
jgi:hypothetical protein